MGILDKKSLNRYSLDNYSLDKHKVDAYMLDGLRGYGPYDSYTKSMLHFNSNFTDEIGKIWTPNTSTIISGINKFGGGSAYFNSTNWIDTPDNSDFDIGSGDFTVDIWVKRNSTGIRQFICGQSDSVVTPTALGCYLNFEADDTIVGAFYSGSTAYLTRSIGTITNTNWHHIALIRFGNTMKLYIDGVNDGSTSVTGITANNSTNKFSIGRLGEYNTQLFNGYIDEFRFSKGIARWTTNFTPPTTEYTT